MKGTWLALMIFLTGCGQSTSSSTTAIVADRPADVDFGETSARRYVDSAEIQFYAPNYGTGWPLKVIGGELAATKSGATIFWTKGRGYGINRAGVDLGLPSLDEIVTTPATKPVERGVSVIYMMANDLCLRAQSDAN